MPVHASRSDDVQRALLAAAESGSNVRDMLDVALSTLSRGSQSTSWGAVIAEREHGFEIVEQSRHATALELERLVRWLSVRGSSPSGEIVRAGAWARAFAVVGGAEAGERAFVVLCVPVSDADPTPDPAADRQHLHAARLLAAIAGPRCLRPPSLFVAPESSADLLFEQAGVGLVIGDMAGHIRRTNQATATFLGRSIDSLAGTHWTQFTHPDDVPRMQVAFNEIVHGVARSRRVEHRFLRPSGQSVWGSSTISLLCDREQRPLSTIIVIEDLTAQRDVEASLERSQARFLLVFEQASLGMTDASPKGVIRAANRRFCELLGYSESELVGKHWSDITVPEDVEANQRIQERALAANEPNYFLEKRYRCKDGRTLWAKIHVSIIRDHAGSVESLFGIIEDLTETHHLTEQLVQTAKMESLGRLAGGIAHDFGNLLTAIANSNVMAKQELESKFGAENVPAVRYLDQAAHAAESATRLTNQLLTFAKRQTFEPRSVALPAVAARVVEIATRLISPNVKITLDQGPADLWRVRGDAGQFEQVLLNLALNARDAIEAPGLIAISLTNERIVRPRASAPGVPPGEWVRLSVADTGRGISPEDLPRVFEPFFSTKRQGFGLGLANVFALVKHWGGHVLATSKVGRGSRFDVWLPKAEPGLPESADVTPHATASLNRVPPASTTVIMPLALVVDDQPEVREMLSVVFERSGYRVVLAGDGREGVELAKKYAADLRSGGVLVTDQRLPHMTGLEVAQAFRKVAPNATVVICSGDVSVIETEAEQHGYRLLGKPFGPAQLLAAVRAGVPDSRRPNNPA